MDKNQQQKLKEYVQKRMQTEDKTRVIIDKSKIKLQYRNNGDDEEFTGLTFEPLVDCWLYDTVAWVDLETKNIKVFYDKFDKDEKADNITRTVIDFFIHTFNYLSKPNKENNSNNYKDYVEDKVSFIMNDQSLEDTVWEYLYKDVLPTPTHSLVLSSDGITSAFSVLDKNRIPKSIIVDSSQHTLEESNIQEPTIGNEHIVKVLNELNTVKYTGVHQGTKYTTNINFEYIGIQPMDYDAKFVFTRKDPNTYILTITGYDNRTTLSHYYNPKGIYFSKSYSWNDLSEYKELNFLSDPVDCVSDKFIVGYDKDKVDERYKKETHQDDKSQEVYQPKDIDSKEAETTSKIDDKPKKKHWWE